MNTIVSYAQEWLGTPYHHAGDIKGVGVDCAMLVVRVFCDLGLVPHFDPRPYPPDWHLHRSGERMLGWIQQYADKVTTPQPGDVAVFRYGRAASHVAIVESTAPEVVLIHASLQAGKVERIEMRRLADAFEGFWRVR